MLGVTDDGMFLWTPEVAFPTLAELKPDVIRSWIRWDEVAHRRPAHGANHRDPAYDWHRYDRIALLAKAQNIRVLFTIVGTPGWANGHKGWNYPPYDMTDLRHFAYAAAMRYSGTQRLDGILTTLPPLPLPGGNTFSTATTLPAVDMWTAWNEPNLGFFLTPHRIKARTPWAIAAGKAYAQICNAVMGGIHAAKLDLRRSGAGFVREKVACGVTAPRKKVTAPRKSAAPIEFLRAMKRFGAKFDVYAHHPHPPSKADTPLTRPRGKHTVSMGNINKLTREVARLYGRKKRVWLTEYAYQTSPPDCTGVTQEQQALYMQQAYERARRHAKIDMLIWFLIRDEPGKPALDCAYSGWQSGLQAVDGTRKPAFAVFRSLAG